MKKKYSVRRAAESDVQGITSLLETYAKQQLLLPRTAKEVQKHISNFVVAECEGIFAGCAALRDYHQGLYEVRSLAVLQEFNGLGIGSALVNSAVDILRKKGKTCRVFALTRRPELFIKLGFLRVTKDLFPEKIWSDCSVCAHKDNCDEDAVMLELKNG